MNLVFIPVFAPWISKVLDPLCYLPSVWVVFPECRFLDPTFGPLWIL